MEIDQLRHLLHEGQNILVQAGKLQVLDQDQPTEKMTDLAKSVSESYHAWLARTIAALPKREGTEVNTLATKSGFFSKGVPDFLSNPLSISPFWNTEGKPNLLPSPFTYPFATCFEIPVRQQLVILESMVQRKPGILNLSSGPLVVPRNLVGHLPAMERFLEANPFENNVFLMMRYRAHNEHLAEIVALAVESTGKRLILARKERITDELSSNVFACLLCSKYGIVLFDEPEDQQYINPNVAYELGVLHFLDRDCLLLKSRTLQTLQTDILSKLYEDYDPSQVGSIGAKVKNWLKSR